MISIVVPLYNEEESIEIFYKELVSELKTLSLQHEIIFIDDGSIDKSLLILKKIAEADKKTTIFSFRKNIGKSEALTFGFQKAKGEYIITLDADLQDRPSQIVKLIKKAQEGYDVVTGWRKKRKDSFIKILSSKLFNFLVNRFWKLELHDYNCGLKLYAKDAAKSLSLYGGMHRFIPLLLAQKGFVITEISVDHATRRFGKSKYGISKLWKDLPDIFTMIFLTKYSQCPLHFFAPIGGMLFIIGFIILAYLTIIHFQGYAIGRRPLLFLGMLLVLSSLQVIFTGFLADLIINISKNQHSEYQDESVLLKYSNEEK